MDNPEFTGQTNIDLGAQIDAIVDPKEKRKFSNPFAKLGKSPKEEVAFDNRSRQYLYLILLLLIGFVGVVQVTGSHEDPIDNLLEFYDDIIEATGFDFDAAFNDSDSDGSSNPKKVGLEKKIVQMPAEARFDPSLVPNPYWPLPNRLTPHRVPMRATWSASEEDSWQVGLNHEFTYQRFKTVRAIRQARLKGSEVLLYEALEQNKLWIRMEALLGLAEFGFEVDVDTVERAVGDAVAGLLPNYLKKFNRERSPGESYVLKQLIRVVDGRARLQILKLFFNSRNVTDDLYIAAAVYDPSPSVQKWLVRNLNFRPIDKETTAQYRAIVVADFRSVQPLQPEEVEIGGLTIEEPVEDEIIEEVEFLQDQVEKELIDSQFDTDEVGDESIEVEEIEVKAE